MSRAVQQNFQVSGLSGRAQLASDNHLQSTNSAKEPIKTSNQVAMMASKTAAACLLSLVFAASAHVHADAATLAGGFATGFMHPVLGWDHVAAMVAVGL